MAPLWVVVVVAIISFGAVRVSYTLRKNMGGKPWRTSTTVKLALRPRKIAGSNIPSLGRERRQFNRIAASLDVAYELLSGKVKVDVASPEDHPGVAILPLVKHFKKGKGLIRDISEGGLAMVGEEAFRIGEQLKLFVKFPEADKTIVIQATVRSCKAVYKDGQNTFKMGLMIVDVDLEDFIHLLDYLFEKRD
jgi:hypothetical protein